MTVANAYDVLLTAALSVLGVLLFLCLIRSILGPRIADRIVAVNMVGTITICIIGVLALKMKEGYLVDVALIYSMLSFLAVVLLTKVYMGVFLERKKKERAMQLVRMHELAEQQNAVSVSKEDSENV
jgi:multicomponent Na+:H+ antiporter subunit F